MGSRRRTDPKIEPGQNIARASARSKTHVRVIPLSTEPFTIPGREKPVLVKRYKCREDHDDLMAKLGPWQIPRRNCRDLCPWAADAAGQAMPNIPLPVHTSRPWQLYFKVGGIAGVGKSEESCQRPAAT